MARTIIITCDRCGINLTERNSQMWDLYGSIDAPEVCDQCFLIGEMAANYTRADVLKNQPIGSTAKAVLKLYEENENV